MGTGGLSRRVPQSKTDRNRAGNRAAERAGPPERHVYSRIVDDTVARMRAHGAELIGEVAQCKNLYRLCYKLGPGGIIVALAEELFT